MLDGQVARLSGRVTRFGGFLDSSLDRLSDMVVFVGLMVFYARDTELHSTLNVFLAGAGLMGSVMVSYASARAESLIPKCDVGFLRRPERCSRDQPCREEPALHRPAEDVAVSVGCLSVAETWRWIHIPARPCPGTPQKIR